MITKMNVNSVLKRCPHSCPQPHILLGFFWRHRFPTFPSCLAWWQFAPAAKCPWRQKPRPASCIPLRSSLCLDPVRPEPASLHQPDPTSFAPLRPPGRCAKGGGVTDQSRNWVRRRKSQFSILSCWQISGVYRTAFAPPFTAPRILHSAPMGSGNANPPRRGQMEPGRGTGAAGRTSLALAGIACRWGCPGSDGSRCGFSGISAASSPRARLWRYTRTPAMLNYNQCAKHTQVSRNDNACASKTFSQTQQSGEFYRINSLRWSASSGSALKPWS